ncbi:glutamate decarboxylase [Auriscalpium vulgare]|uniref:Glutamate decarboxylase n=1 Tax=Auriscalpium vulgare TaxID=40419 RepID=A0ACB8RFA0_9AGAM|nr:glutamate decarboxylase [Auriscalpium vulgare]
MSLSNSKHINSEQLLQESREKKERRRRHSVANTTLPRNYGARYGSSSLPKYSMPSTGIDADSAYQILHDELSLDGSPLLNLASFVATWMPPAADKLMMENISKNLVNQEEYPVTQDLHARCISILADLWHAPSSHLAVGTATTGSSEAIMLGGLAMKRIWQEKRRAAGKSIHEPGPNIVMGANAQVALEKFARYFEVEARLVPISQESKYRLDPKKAIEYVDENTIGVYVILGSTYTGHYEPVKEMAELLDQFEEETGHYVPIHVDGASGAFIAPFATPRLEWDFRIPRVVSINTSGHKFGLSYVGVGWIIWRTPQHLPKDLIFEIHYLGCVEHSFSLTFSRPAHPVIAQYYNFLHLGYQGYRNAALCSLQNARLLSCALEVSGYFTVLSDIHRPPSAGMSLTQLAKYALDAGDRDDGQNYEPGLPVVAFRFSDEFQAEHPETQQKWIQTLLRAKGWIVPNYELAPGLAHVQILRVVVRETLSEALIDRLVKNLLEVTESLIENNSSSHALNALGQGRAIPAMHQHEYGRIDKEDMPEHPGESSTYAKL